MKFILSILFTISVSLATAQEYGKLVGRVMDKESCEDIGLAYVLATQLPNGNIYPSKTDFNGAFELEALPAGEYSVVIKFLGYRDYVTQIKIIPGQSTFLEAQLQDIIISCGCSARHTYPTFFEIQGRTYSREEIRKMP